MLRSKSSLLVVLSLGAFIGCGAAPPTSGTGGTGGPGGPPGTGGSGGAGGSGGDAGSAGTGGLQSGTLTAGAWDDNQNYDFFLEYRDDQYVNQRPGLLPFDHAAHDAAHARFTVAPGAKQTLDVALVLDTTGSMGDEIRYLQTEFVSISSAVYDKYPSAAQRWSLIAYRDDGDDFVVRSYPFETSAATFQANLNLQSAGGGGDFPEAPDQALQRAAELPWRTTADTAKIVFWVADAPHHDQKAAAMAAAIEALGQKNVHIYPVASSGIDAFTELTMRTSAQLTGGRYLFLTDDSGVGGAHEEPSAPCYYVTRLDQAIIRMIDIELSGTYAAPLASQIIRTKGDPSDGVCQLESGTFYPY